MLMLCKMSVVAFYHFDKMRNEIDCYKIVQTLFNEMYTYPCTCIMCREYMSILSDLLMTQGIGLTSVQLLARVPASVWCTEWWGTSSTSRRGRGRVKCSTTTCGDMTSRKYMYERGGISFIQDLSNVRKFQAFFC